MNKKWNNMVAAKHQRIARALFTLAMASLFSGCALGLRAYSAAPIGGRVIDIETKKPVAGAYVVATYNLVMGMEGGSHTPLHYEETRTDREGRFHFNGFDKTPIPYPRAARNATLQDDDPEFYIFAEGYRPRRSVREINSRTYPLRHRVSILDGRDIALQPFNKTELNDQIRSFSSYTSSLITTINGGYPDPSNKLRCTYHKIPRTIHFLRELSFRYLAMSEGKYISFRIPERVGCEWRSQSASTTMATAPSTRAAVTSPYRCNMSTPRRALTTSPCK